jgi:hypothetical protein
MYTAEILGLGGYRLISSGYKDAATVPHASHTYQLFCYYADNRCRAATIGLGGVSDILVALSWPAHIISKDEQKHSGGSTPEV